MEDADPANPDAFRAGGQPQVLYCTDGAIQIHLLHVGAAQDSLSGALTVAGDAQVDGGIRNAFQLQTAVKIFALIGKQVARFLIGLAEQPLNTCFGVCRANQQKVPGLHKPY